MIITKMLSHSKIWTLMARFCRTMVVVSRKKVQFSYTLCIYEFEFVFVFRTLSKMR
jgi:hypothetical protein